MSVDSVIARTAKVYLPKTPTAGELATLANRVSTGVVSLNQQILEIANSTERDRSVTDSLVKMFFILLDRAPDYSTYREAITLLEGGYSMSQLASVGLSLKAGPLSDTLKLSHTEFIERLAAQVFETPSTVLGLEELKADLLGQLNSGVLTRSQIIDLAVNYSSPNTQYEADIETALYYLAAGAREASSAELASARGANPLVLLRTVLNESGESPTGALLYLQRASSNLLLDGALAGTLQLDLSQPSTNLDGQTTPRIISSLDGGATEQSSSFSPGLLAGVTQIDARPIGEGLESLMIKAGHVGVTAYAPDSPTIFRGGTGLDRFTGGAAADQMYASAGSDKFTGGEGADTFFLPSSNVFLTQTPVTTISDFGVGVDALDFSLTFGRQTTTGPLTPIVGTADRDNGYVDLTGLVNGSIVLVSHTGVWVDETPTGIQTVDLGRRTPAQIAALFSVETVTNGQTAITPVVFATPPTRSSSYIVMTINDFYGADVWLVSNFSNLSQISESEVKLIGILEPSGDLYSALTTAGALLG